MKRRLKVGLPRGVALSQFEMQNFEPIMERADLTAYRLSTNVFDTKNLRLPVKILRFPDEAWLPGNTSFVRKYYTYVRGLRYYMYGLEKELSDKDVIHSWESDYGFSFQSARVKEKSGNRLVITHWNLIPFADQKTNTSSKRAAYVRERTDVFVAITTAAKDCLLREGVPEGKIRVLPMGIDQKKFSPGPKDPKWLGRYGLEHEHLVVLFLGRFAREKGVHQLLGAAKRLKEKKGETWRRVRFLFVGEGPEKEAMRRFVQEQSLDGRVLIAAPVPYREIHNIHRLADVFVLPSIPSAAVQEQFGYALVESMGCGTAIVVSECGGLPEIGGDAVLVYPAADEVKLAERIAAFVENESWRTRYGRKSRERAVRFYDSRKIAQQLHALYCSLV